MWEVNFWNSSLYAEDIEMWCKGLMSAEQTAEEVKITSLEFSDNNIALEGMKWFVNIPSQILHHLRTLGFGFNQLDGIGLGVLCKIIPKLTSLQTLGLRDNPIGCGGAVQVLKCLYSHRIPLKTLYLGFTGVGEEDCIVLHDLIVLTDLKTLWIDGNNLTSNCVDSILQGLLQSSTMEDLHMSYSQFIMGNCMSLASLLQWSDCQLRDLEVVQCGIADEGVAWLATALTCNHSLIILDLSRNTIGESGAAALRDMLALNTVLRELWIAKCGITSDGAVQLCTGVSENNTLEILDISKNDIGIKGAKAVSNMIEENRSLMTLSVCGDDSLGEGMATILSSLKKNSTLKKIYLPEEYQCPADDRVNW